MAFTATKREAAELYTFFRLLQQGKAISGTATAQPDEDKTQNIAMIQRMEHDGPRRYYIEEENVRIEWGEWDHKNNLFLPKTNAKIQNIPRNDFAQAADALLDAMKKQAGAETEIDDELQQFLEAANIQDLEAKTDDRTDLSVAFGHKEAPLTGFCVRCRLSNMNPLLDGGRTANLKFEQTGVKFAAPTVNKVNATTQSATPVTERMLMIERLGGVLKYSDVADKVFRCNLMMIDLHFPRVLAEMVKLMHIEGITRVSELTQRIKQINPLKIKDELINKHGYYEHKMKQFLLTLALGMRPAKIYNGTDSKVEGMFLVNTDGTILTYHKQDAQTFADFLFLNSRLEKGVPEKDKYGFLERENGTYYLKLNVKIGLLKR